MGLTHYKNKICEPNFISQNIREKILKMIFLILTIGLVTGFTMNQENGVTEVYDTRDLWYGGEKLTITAYEKQGVGYFRLKGVDNWGFKWDKCNGPTRFLIRYFKLNPYIYRCW